MTLLTRTAELDLARRWRNQRDQAARDRLILSHRADVEFLAKRYWRPGLDPADLIQAGWAGPTRAAETFDPERGFRFRTYALNWILSYVSDVNRDARRHTEHTISLTGPCYQFNDGDEMTLADVLASPDPQLAATEARCAVTTHVVRWLPRLRPQERLVIQYRYLEHRHPTLTEVGRQLGVSRERIRQIETAALAHLRRLIFASRPS